MFNEFKKFALRGNVMDLAIAVILGGAFGKIVSSFVADIMMPPIGLLLGKVDFSNLYLNLSGGTFTSLEEAKKAGAPTLNYGIFLNQVIDFLIVAFAIFVIVNLLSKLKHAEEVQAPATKGCPFLLHTGFCTGYPVRILHKRFKDLNENSISDKKLTSIWPA